jgi:hypothetical protein
MAGYSDTPLLKKLGIKSDQRLFISNPPDPYFDYLSPLPRDVSIMTSLSGQADFIHLFCTEFKELRKEMPKARKHIKQDGMIWVSWPKKASKMQTDLDENKIRDFGLENGLVDVKVCAVDDVWSGLKFVIRVKDRVKK